MRSGIYKITNTANNKIYIGSSKDLAERWASHKQRLRKQTHANAHLQSAWNTYGEDAFRFEVVEYVPDPAHLLKKEQWYLDNTKCLDRECGYNICPSAFSSSHSDETRAKISAARSGTKASAETKAKLSAERKGKKKSLEWREQMSKLPRSAEWREKIAAGVVAYHEKMSQQKTR